MVLTRDHLLQCLLGLAVVALLGACSQSLFDNGGTPGDDTNVPETCPAPCLGDAGGDFDGSPAGSTGRWRYLDDRRDRTWTPMAEAGGAFVGADPTNAITSCAKKPDAPACQSIPGALLLSSSGANSGADPAVEFTVQNTQVIKLAFRAAVADGNDQIIRVYRNSREDVLITRAAAVGNVVDDSIEIDALAGDRLLVAVAPSGFGAQDVALQVFVSDTGQVFPAQCKLAVSFAGAMGNSVQNACGAQFTNNDFNAGTMIPPTLAGGAFAEEGMAADIVPNTYYTGGDVLDKNGDITIQMWVRVDAIDPIYAGWAFSDMDLNAGGGVGVAFYEQSDKFFEVSTCTNPNTNPIEIAGEHVPFTPDGAWHFIRIVHTNGQVSTCLDGKRVMSFALPAGKLQSTFKPHFGKNVVWTPAGAFFDGGVDDIRVFSTALRCD